MGTFGLVFDQGKERDVVVLGQVFEEIVGADLATADERVREVGGEHQDFHGSAPLTTGLVNLIIEY